MNLHDPLHPATHRRIMEMQSTFKFLIMKKSRKTTTKISISTIKANAGSSVKVI